MFRLSGACGISVVSYSGRGGKGRESWLTCDDEVCVIWRGSRLSDRGEGEEEEPRSIARGVAAVRVAMEKVRRAMKVVWKYILLAWLCF